MPMLTALRIPAIMIGLCFVLSFSGCLDNSGQASDELDIDNQPDETQSGTRPEPDPTLPPVASGLSGRLQLDGCAWIHTSYDHPLNTNPMPVPPGWDPETGRPFTTNVVRAFQCASVALDDLDRPATVLLVASNAGTPPRDCYPEKDGSYLAFIPRILVDDAELAQVLKQRYGAPAEVAAITMQSDETAITWSWTDAGVKSSLMYPQNILEDDVPETPRRWAWPTEDGIMVLDAEFTAFGPDSSSRYVTGELPPQYHMGVDGHFVGPAAAGPDGSVSGRFTQLGPSCAPPE